MVNKKIQKECKGCGDKFLIYKCAIKRGRGQFCSKKCNIDALILWVKRYHLGNNSKTSCVCVYCDKSFLAYPAHKRKLCSRICMGKWFSENLKGEQNGNWQGGLPKCLNCKKQLTSYSAMFCKKCMRGEHSNAWKGGTTTQDKLERARFKKEMQKLIFERDNYTCQICSVRGIALQVDHIQRWSKYVELRFSIDNCRTLCVACHYKITFNKEMPKNIKTWGQNLKEGLVV